MVQKIQSIKGMNDILPEEIFYWQFIENKLRQLTATYGYEEIRTPILEETELFQRSIGEVTDIVEKEMYTFADRNGESVTMRPEGTASVVRAGIEHGLFYNQIQRLWYLGPIFRYERPQKGRYRQFYQFGMEAIGIEGAAIDAELILFSARLWQELNLKSDVHLQLNSLGSLQSRINYREALTTYLLGYQTELDEDSQRRLKTNPLRILDSKNPQVQSILQGAPNIADYWDEISKQHFASLQLILEANHISYEINPRLVRGLDYYCDTVFEWVTQKLGAQSAVAAGGRYDNLIQYLGGQTTPAVGFAMGMERVIELLQQQKDSEIIRAVPDIYFMLVGSFIYDKGMALIETVRTRFPNLRVLTHLSGGSFKNQFKKADKSGAQLALILGENEIATDTISIKFLRIDKPQVTVKQNELVVFLENYISQREVL